MHHVRIKHDLLKHMETLKRNLRMREKNKYILGAEDQYLQ